LCFVAPRGFVVVVRRLGQCFFLKRFLSEQCFFSEPGNVHLLFSVKPGDVFLTNYTIIVLYFSSCFVKRLRFLSLNIAFFVRKLLLFCCFLMPISCRFSSVFINPRISLTCIFNEFLAGQKQPQGKRRGEHRPGKKSPL